MTNPIHAPPSIVALATQRANRLGEPHFVTYDAELDVYHAVSIRAYYGCKMNGQARYRILASANPNR